MLIALPFPPQVLFLMNHAIRERESERKEKGNERKRKRVTKRNRRGRGREREKLFFNKSLISGLIPLGTV